MNGKRIAGVLACLLTMLALLCACSKQEPGTDKTAPDGDTSGTMWTVKIVDGITRDTLAEVQVADGGTVTLPEVTKDGYLVEGFYATPALKTPFDTSKPITEDKSVFVAWKSGMEDNRPWMLAGSLRGYPENAWGKIWPQDDFLLQKVDGEFNTFDITVNLYEGDSFKIAVIGEGYEWDNDNSIDARMLADKSDSAPIVSGEDAFDSGANIEVKQDGKYRLILVTDAETLNLCKLSYERLGDADELHEIVYDMKLWASFNNWAGQDMTRNGDDLIWYCEADVPAEGGEFGVKNAATDDWYSSEGNTKNIELTEGHYMFFIELELVGGKPQLKGEIVAQEPAYYVVGTCGNGGWAADANADNGAHMLQKQSDGTYSATITFTDNETADWAENKVAFKVVYGCGGYVPNECWYGADGMDNITVDPGTYTITFDPATGSVTVA